MERMDSTSAAVLRRAAYRAMEEAGVDITKLVHGAREEIIAERKARAERSANSLERLREWTARIPELSAAVHRGPPGASGKVRELLEQKKSVDEIQVLLGLDRPFIKAVRDLDKARAAKNKLTDDRKSIPRKHWERLERLMQRPVWSSGPTKERKRHAGEGEEFAEAKVAGEQKTHQLRWPVDQIREMLTPEEYDAALQLYDAYWNGLPGSKIGSLDGGGGGSDPATRLGLTPKQQAAGRVWAALWPQLATGLKFTAQNLIICRPWGGAERALTFVELGRRVGMTNGEQQARGVGQGMLKATCAALAQIAKDYDNRIAAEKRQVFRSLLQHADVLHWIADASNAAGEAREEAQRTAVGLMCKRTNFQAWIIQACVKSAVDDGKRKRERNSDVVPEMKTSATRGGYGSQRNNVDAL